MAKFTTAAGIEDLTGKLSKEDRIVMRQKKYRLPNGHAEPVTGKRVIAQFDNFVRSVLSHE